jgi:Na+-translocating ferredoxin:NAD+ oxidoreductase RnfG subunit
MSESASSGANKPLKKAVTFSSQKNQQTISLVILVVLCCVLIVGVYWYLKLRVKSVKAEKPQLVQQPVVPPPKVNDLENTKSRTVESIQPIIESKPHQIVVKPMYVPVETGVRTGEKHVFMTSKGLRVYEVNEFGFPLPKK